MNHQSSTISNYRSGFTLIEMLVGLALFGTVALFIIGIVSKIYRSRSESAQVEFMQGATASIIQLLTQDVHSSTGVVLYQTSGMTQAYFSLPNDSGEEDEIAYTVEEDQLQRDGQAITPETVKVSNFQIENEQEQDKLPLLKVSFTVEATHYTIPPVEKTLFLSMREKGE